MLDLKSQIMPRRPQGVAETRKPPLPAGGFIPQASLAPP